MAILHLRINKYGGRRARMQEQAFIHFGERSTEAWALFVFFSGVMKQLKDVNDI